MPQWETREAELLKLNVVARHMNYTPNILARHV